MAIDNPRMDGGLSILWNPNSICLLECKSNHFSLITKFIVLDTGEKGTMVNVYGPSAFH